MNFHELQKVRVVELRQMVAKHGVEGTSAWKKEQLVNFMAEKLGIELVDGPRETIGHVQLQHLIEVTIIKPPVPAN